MGKIADCVRGEEEPSGSHECSSRKLAALLVVLAVCLPVPSQNAQAEFIAIYPSDFAEGTDLTDVGVGAILSSPSWIPVAFGSFTPPSVIGKRNPSPGGGIGCCWATEDMFRVDFETPTDFVAVAFERGALSSEWTGFGVIEAFDSNGMLLESAMTELMDPSIGREFRQVSIQTPGFDIDHMLIGEETLAGFDIIRVRAIGFDRIPEPTTVLLLCAAAVALALRERRMRARTP